MPSTVRTPILVPCARGVAGSGTLAGPVAFADYLRQRAGSYRAVASPFFAERRELTVVGADADALSDALSAQREQAEAAGTAPIYFGGDHSCTYELISHACERHGPLVLVVFDAHSDVQGDVDQLYHWNVLAKIASRWGPQVEIIHLGFRDIDGAALAACAGLVLSALDVCWLGVAACARRVAEAIAGRPVYLSIDLDVLDPGAFAGVAAPISAGLSPLALFALIDALRVERVVCADIVEYDHHRSDGREMLLLADLFHLVGGVCAHEDPVLDR
ncbi:MAG: agmatinase [Haliangiales bacterium]